MLTDAIRRLERLDSHYPSDHHRVEGSDVLVRYPDLQGTYAVSRDDPDLTIPSQFLSFDGTELFYFGDIAVIHGPPIVDDHTAVTKFPMLAVAQLNPELDPSPMAIADTELSAFHPYSIHTDRARRFIRAAFGSDERPVIMARNLRIGRRLLGQSMRIGRRLLGQSISTASDLTASRERAISVDSLHVRFAAGSQLGTCSGPLIVAVPPNLLGVYSDRWTPGYLWVPPGREMIPTLDFIRHQGSNGIHLIPYDRLADNTRHQRFLHWVGETSLSPAGFGSSSDAVRFATEFPEL